VDRGGPALTGALYPELTKFLLEQPETQDRIALSLLAVQALLNDTLPLDAFLPSWWENDPAIPHSKSWLNAGWEVDEVNPGRGVAFTRVSAP
jgi:hypothetical protein